MVELKNLFSEIGIIANGKRGGDKIKLSDSKGNVINFDPVSRQLATKIRKQAEVFIRLLESRTGWIFNPTHWSWGPYRIIQFRKGSVKPGKARYNTLLAQNPLSLAIISGQSIEYTIDENREF